MMMKMSLHLKRKRKYLQLEVKPKLNKLLHINKRNSPPTLAMQRNNSLSKGRNNNQRPLSPRVVRTSQAVRRVAHSHVPKKHPLPKKPRKGRKPKELSSRRHRIVLILKKRKMNLAQALVMMRIHHLSLTLRGMSSCAHVTRKKLSRVKQRNHGLRRSMRQT